MKPPSILVIDDEPDNFDVVIETFLSSENYYLPLNGIVGPSVHRSTCLPFPLFLIFTNKFMINNDKMIFAIASNIKGK